MNLEFLETINQKLKSLNLESDERKMIDVFSEDEILELRKYENFKNDFMGIPYTFDDYIKTRKWLNNVKKNSLAEKKRHDARQNYFQKFYK